MASPTSSSTPSSEITGKPHPYQYDKDAGAAKGAYEARKVRAGFYIRVDMPGVIDDTVKVVKYDETRTITFVGKAYDRWAGFGGASRVYGGYVVLDRDLADVDFESHLKNGCLRMFFRRCDGSLHFLSPHLPPSSSSPPGQNDEVQMATLEDEPAAGQDEEEKIAAVPTDAFIVHYPENPSAIHLEGGSAEHINPYQLSGVKGVYEHKIVTIEEGGEKLIYIRMDVPDTCGKSTGILKTPRKDFMFSSMAFKKEYYSRFDSASREYHGKISPACHCCTYDVYKYENFSGVLRILLRRSADNGSSTGSVHFYMPPLIGGKCLVPARLSFPGPLPAAFGLLQGGRKTSKR